MPQNIILCIERSKKPCEFPEAIANLYMNRFAIDEDVAFEIVDIIRLTGIHNDKTEKHLLRNAFEKAMLAENLPLPIHIFWATVSPSSGRMNDIKQLLLEFQIDSALLTTISWTRMSLLSQESTKIMYKGIANYTDINIMGYQITFDITQNSRSNLNATFKKHLHDELDLFFHGMRKNKISSFIGNRDRKNFTFTVQKLTKTELSLLEKMDKDYFATFVSYNKEEWRKKIDLKKLKLSESKSRYKLSSCSRCTLFIPKSES